MIFPGSEDQGWELIYLLFSKCTFPPPSAPPPPPTDGRSHLNLIILPLISSVFDRAQFSVLAAVLKRCRRRFYGGAICSCQFRYRCSCVLCAGSLHLMLTDGHLKLQKHAAESRLSLLTPGHPYSACMDHFSSHFPLQFLFPLPPFFFSFRLVLPASDACLASHLNLFPHKGPRRIRLQDVPRKD